MMVRAKIPARHFFEAEVFDAEQKVIFQNTWQFFCLKTDLKNNNDFVAETVGGIPVVVQNMRGKLLAFHNVCSHRNSPLQTGKSGNRRLFCPYHGWVFGDTGQPIGIPHNLEFYPIEPAEKPDLALRSFGIETCGNLVFVSIAAEFSLAHQLGEWFPLLSNIGGSMSDMYFGTELPADCNWKFAVENAFDDIHAQFVHPASSLDTSVYTDSTWKFYDFDAGDEDLKQSYCRRHAQLNVGMSIDTVRRNCALWEPFFPSRSYAFDDYLHLFVYPNLVITSVQGFWYNIVRYKPLSAERSTMDYWLVPSSQRSGEPSRPTPELLYRLALGSLRVFEEDIRAVEVAQSGIRSVGVPGVFGKREDKIVSFEAAYMSLFKQVKP